MTIELQMLALSAALGLVQIVLSAHAASFQYGYRWAASARDQAMPPLTGVAARLERALSNFMETFPLEALFRKALDRNETGPAAYIHDAKPTARAVVEGLLNGAVDLLTKPGNRR